MFFNEALPKRANVIPPIIALPTGDFEGNDGNWSTFEVRVGTPAQKSRVLPCTLIPETWVVYAGACDAGVDTDPNCATDRGGDPNLFDSNSSTTWDFVHGYTFAVEANLGISQNIAGNYAYDTLGLATSSNSGGVVLAHQAVASYGDTTFYLGNLGLSNRLPTFGNNTESGFLGSLFAQNKIPSLSYSYTAGSFYNSQTNASLVLGGYDAARFEDSGLSFALASNDQTRNSDLVVGVQSIDYADNTGTKTNLMNTGILTFIDSTLPNIWLPQAACDSMQAAFGLSFNDYNQQYSINDSQRMLNYRQDASVTFTIGASISNGSTVAIKMPYAAFDLNMTTQSGNTTHYFPLRRAGDPTSYTLGRAFLQEAVLTVDYGRGNFSVNQAIPVASSQQNVVPILNGTSQSAPGSGSNAGGSGTSSGTGGSKGANAGAIGGGVAGGVVALAAILIAAFFWWRKRKTAAAKASTGASEAGSNNTQAEQYNEMAMAKAASPPPVYPGTTDYFGTNAKDGIHPAGTPGSSSMGSPHNALGISQQNINPYTGISTPSSVVTPPAATVNDLSFQHAYNNNLLAPNQVPANIAAQGGAGAALLAELQGSEASAMPHELHSPASRSELDTPISRSELGAGEQRSELWTPASVSNSASPATHSPHLAAVLEQPGELPGDGLIDRPIGGSTSVALGNHTQSQRSSNTLPAAFQPVNISSQAPGGDHFSTGSATSSAYSNATALPPLPANANMNITAAELSSRPLSGTATFFTENTLTPSPEDHGAGQTGYFSSNSSVAGSDVGGGVSRGSSIMNATSVAIAGTGRPNVVTHHRSGSSIDAATGLQRHAGFETIGEEQENDTDVRRS